MGERILVVGCGGLGCELLKLLALVPTDEIVVIDDDTVDPTNLNRQFLFSSADVNQSKSVTAAGRLSRNVKKRGANVKEQSSASDGSIQALFCKVNDYKKVGFYESFDVVYNCLDNNETRSFVNQRCHLAGVPMIDGGSAGWLGQSFHNGRECFDCLPKKTERMFPVCSIRQKPLSFEHCLVWAKTLVEKSDRDASKEGRFTEAPEGYLESSSRICVMREEPQRESDSTGEDGGLESAKRFKNNSEHADLPKNATDETKMRAIYGLACTKAGRFGIQTLSLIDSQTFIEKIVPSICTTNSMVASLMILSRRHRKNYFLVQSSSRFVAVDLNERNPECLTCSLPVYLCKFSGLSTSENLLAAFKATSMATEQGLFDVHNSCLLCELDGGFAIVSRNELRYRFYFEKTRENGAELEFKRIR